MNLFQKIKLHIQKKSMKLWKKLNILLVEYQII